MGQNFQLTDQVSSAPILYGQAQNGSFNFN